jgi:hypothetical protein
MGCCVTLPSKEDLLINFWNNLPIRNISLLHYRDSILATYESKFKVDSVMSFKKFFLNEHYLVYGDSDIQTVCRSLFEDLIVQFSPVKVIFVLAFLCDFHPDNAKNAKALYDIASYFGIDNIRFEANCYWFDKYRLSEVIKTYLEIIFNISITYVFTLVDEDEFKDHLLQRYNRVFIEEWVNEHMKKYSNVFQAADFLQNNVSLIADLYYIKVQFDKSLPKVNKMTNK